MVENVGKCVLFMVKNKDVSKDGFMLRWVCRECSVCMTCAYSASH